MKYKNILLKSVIITVLTAISFASCNKDDDQPSYVGTWTYTFTQHDNSRVTSTVILTPDTFDETYQVYDNATKSYTQYAKIKGTMEVIGSSMNSTVKSLTIVNYDNVPGGEFITYEENHSLFNSVMDSLGQKKTFYAYFSNDGHTLSFNRKIYKR
jgi:hypothetical protein